MEKKPILTEKRISPVRRSEGRLEKRETFKPTPVSVPKRDLTPKPAPVEKKAETPVKPVTTPVKTTFTPEPEEDIFASAEAISNEPLTEEEMSYLSLRSAKKEPAVEKKEVPEVISQEKEDDVIAESNETSYREIMKFHEESAEEKKVSPSEKIVIKPARDHSKVSVFVLEIAKESPAFTEYSNDLKKSYVWFDSILKLVSKNSLNKIFADLYPNGIPGSFLKTKTSLYVSSLVKSLPETLDSAYIVVEVPNEKQDLFSEDLKEVEILRMFLVSTRAIFL